MFKLMFFRVVFSRNIILLFLICAVSGSLHAQTDTIDQRIVLIGDAGQLTNGKHPVVQAVRNLITLDKKTTVLFLGDNIYRNGLPDTAANDYQHYRAILDSQLSVADGTPARVIMIPGNHDWRNGQRDGYDAIVREQFYVSFLNKSNVSFVPEEGCPGPVEIPLGNNVVLLLFDSQWFLHPYDKPEIESDCDCKTPDEVATQMRDLAVKNSKKLIIVGDHHPFKSSGPHGGFFTWQEHLFPFTDMRPNLYIPLPVLGSIYPLERIVFGTPQDLKAPPYAKMISDISNAVKANAKNVLFVSGHEHNLQLIKDSSYHYIISGSGSKINHTTKRKNTLFSSASNGFTVLEVSKNKNVTVTFYEVGDSVKKVYSSTLLNFSPAKAVDTITAEVEAATNLPDSVTRPASKLYPPINGLKKYFMGQNYRVEWSTPVHMKTLDITKEKGGLTVQGLGGSDQTRSLLLKDSRGKDWVLRSVEKNPSGNVPAPFRTYVAAGLSKEINTAAHPYGALIVPGLTKALNLSAPEPELFFVEDDNRLKGYRKDFAGRVCMLEERFIPIKGKDTLSSSKVFNELIKDNDHRANQPVVLTARLLDILIGDYDRHLDQWKWSKNSAGKGVVYSPIPRDRDEAFFNSDGKLLNMLSYRVLPFLKGFRHDIIGVNWLGYTAKDFDRIFLTDLDVDEWKKSISNVQQKLTDSVIHAAVKRLPPEIYAIDGQKIESKLITRRDALPKAAMTYYKYISKKVNIVGSNQREYFKVSNYGAGLQVRVYEIGRGEDTSFIMYNRIFDPSVTKEIRLYGLNDDDVFDIEENAKSRIKFRLIGGNGNDTFNVRGHVENLLYDRTKPDLNVVTHPGNSKKRFTIDPPANSRSLIGFNYNTTKFPEFIGGYNSDDDLLVGIGFQRRTYGFDNLPYASNHDVDILYSTRHAWRFNYEGIINHITRAYDVELRTRYARPALKNFFGLGNNTVTSGRNLDFYRIRYKELEMEAIFRKRRMERLHYGFGPWFYQYQNQYSDNTNNILSSPGYKQDSANIFSRKSYLGGKVMLSFDNTNNELFPTRGIIWRNEVLVAAGMTPGSHTYSKFTTDMTMYASQTDAPKWVGILRFGGGKILSKNYEFFQTLDIGADNDLRGFRKNRYSGTSNLYGSFELRVKIADVNSYILPGQFGILGYYDIGKVWLRHESSRTLHTGFGGGFYFLPFNLFIISATAGFSEQERAYNVSIGTKFNLNF